MPSSDRSEPRDAGPRPEPREGASGPAHRDTPHGAPGDSQYFDPAEPWDRLSAEALTLLHESEDGRLWRRRESETFQRRAAPMAQHDADEAAARLAALEPRLLDLTRRLQDTISTLDPDKTLAPLNRRLDAIEQRLAEALSTVAQRADVDGLKLIEAQVIELATHVEQTRSRLDRLDVIDERIDGLARKLDEDGLQRLDTLERTLQSYVAEWRRSEERTSSALGALDETLTRIGGTIDAADALKPAIDLSLPAFGLGEAGPSPVGTDPLSQVYANAARALAPHPHASLDAADYTPGAPISRHAERDLDEETETAEAVESELPSPAAEEPDFEPIRPPAMVSGDAPLPDIAARSPVPGSSTQQEPELGPPAFRASAMRAKLRRLQLLDADGGAPAETPAPRIEEPSAMPRRGARPSLLLAAGITLFAAAGYLLVDVFMTPPQLAPKQGQHPATDPGTKAEPAPGSEPPTKRAGRIETIGAALAAVVREAAPAAEPAVHKEAPAPMEGAISRQLDPPALTIGPASLRQAAMSGDAAAQYEIGLRYAAGRGVPADPAKAVQWYARAAARGLAPAQFRLAAMYERGHGTPADAERARTWYQRAADQGHVKAMHNLAVLSIAGGRSDYATAAQWFAKAAEHGLADSQFNLAVLHQNGLGVPKDLKLAYQWLTLAARAGDREAASRVALVAPQLTPAQLSAADAAIASWRARPHDPEANDIPTVYGER